jgi:hypothetical protein
LPRPAAKSKATALLASAAALTVSAIFKLDSPVATRKR